MRRALAIGALSLLLLGAEPAPAPDRPLPDPAQEARAQALFDDIRCVVCQHEAIADSPAGIAADMRRLVREQIASGATNQQVRQDLVRRYGDYVLFRPPVRTGTWLLWFGPLALLVAAGTVLLLTLRRSHPAAEALTADEERRLADLVREEKLRREADATSPHDGL